MFSIKQRHWSNFRLLDVAHINKLLNARKYVYEKEKIFLFSFSIFYIAIC